MAHVLCGEVVLRKIILYRGSFWLFSLSLSLSLLSSLPHRWPSQTLPSRHWDEEWFSWPVDLWLSAFAGSSCQFDYWRGGQASTREKDCSQCHSRQCLRRCVCDTKRVLLLVILIVLMLCVFVCVCVCVVSSQFSTIQHCIHLPSKR